MVKITLITMKGFSTEIKYLPNCKRKKHLEYYSLHLDTIQTVSHKIGWPIITVKTFIGTCHIEFKYSG